MGRSNGAAHIPIAYASLDRMGCPGWMLADGSAWILHSWSCHQKIVSAHII
jgi:hypothetical protein